MKKIGYIYIVLSTILIFLAADYSHEKDLRSLAVPGLVANADDDDDDDEKDDDDDDRERSSDEDDDDEEEDGGSRESETILVEQTTTQYLKKVTIIKDTDQDGLLDPDDPHPLIPEILIVKDDNLNGIVDDVENIEINEQAS